METKKTKRLFNFLLLLLVLPLLIHLVGLPKLKSLKGAVTESPKPQFAVTKWFEGDYQKEAEVYLNEKFGLRNFFIRLNNQVAYSLYGKANAESVVIGKDGYLFEKSYIEAYYGRDFLGKDSIDGILNKVRYIQDTLKKRGIDLVIMLNPGKASYYPEKIPNEFRSQKNISNTEYFAAKSKKLHLNLLDLRTYFIKNKTQIRYPLFTKCGIHWSTYCEVLAIDTMLAYIGDLRKSKAPKIVIDSIMWDDGNKFRDADVLEGMNLLWSQNCGTAAYPIYHVIEKDRQKQKTIVISDSFYWGIYSNPKLLSFFESNAFWYYYSELYATNWEQFKYLDQINIQQEIEKNNLVIIMATESTLTKFGWGFVDQAFEAYKRPLNK